MFCDQCGKKMQEDQRFCPGCGREVGSAPTPASGTSRLSRHLRLLGVFWIVWAAFWLIGAGTMVVVGHLTLGLFAHGRLLPRAEHIHAGPQMVMLVAAAILVLLGVASLAAGWGLLQRCSWARVLALVVGCFSLTTFPFGTALGIYTLWVLLPAASRREYDSGAV